MQVFSYEICGNFCARPSPLRALARGCEDAPRPQHRSARPDFRPFALGRSFCEVRSRACRAFFALPLKKYLEYNENCLSLPLDAL